MSKLLSRRVAKLEAIKQLAKRTTNKVLHYFANESVGRPDSDTIVWQIGYVPKGFVGRGKLGQFKGKFMLVPHFENESDWEIAAQKQQNESLKFDAALMDKRRNAVKPLTTNAESVINEWSGVTRN